MNALKMLTAIEAEIKYHQDALARLGRLRAALNEQITTKVTWDLAVTREIDTRHETDV